VFSGFIDVWNAKTFDCELGATLAEEADLVRNHMTTEHRIAPTTPMRPLSTHSKRRSASGCGRG
jgi:hypothetical protein